MINDIDLGPIEAYEEFPVEVTIDHNTYWLVRCSDYEFRLLNSLCPHAGGEVRPSHGVLFCPLHFWTFDIDNGQCINNPDKRLMKRDVELRFGRLFVVSSDY
ncbi:MAG: Rieske 2Fe-2S domain-containing protein [Candidatus Cohnella colombiensis]|uniref:Rieske 2Fe-2S domain-containing protein n=1 Tax=Candidatus Cohnella colombiensis TaxID=3121368 RepID=A0AA95EYI0_9BACL|nr:MAG: Rieske 2Fe-2S domain-containing protein [Cohnella sp.]